MTYRERRMAKAERLRGWAEKRMEGVAAVAKEADKYRGDVAFNTQPGHIPERARLNARQERSWESQTVAGRMSSRAANIETAADHAIYNDDPDALDRLRERVAELEAQRDRKKAINKVAKTGNGWEDRVTPPLTEPERKDLATCARFYAKAGYPTYVFTNLSGNIRRQQARVVELERQAVHGKPWRYYPAAKYPGKCLSCGQEVKGEPILYRDEEVKHTGCDRMFHRSELIVAGKLKDSGAHCYCKQLVSGYCDFCTELRTPQEVANG